MATPPPSRASAGPSALLGLLAVGLVYASRYHAHPGEPWEDAAMLFRYAEHLAAGQGFVWNLGEAPVDGATDFLWTLVLAGAARLGWAVPAAAHGIGVACHLLTVLALYWFGVRRQHAPWPVALLPALFVLVGPGLPLARAGFGTPFFGLLVVAMALAADSLVRREEPGGELTFGLASLLVGLARPEGNLLSGAVGLGVLAALPAPRRRRVALTFLACVAGLGSLYLLWRWSTFGALLPNPFLKKGGFRLHTVGLVVALKSAGRFGFPFLWVYPLARHSEGAARRAAPGLAGFLGFTLVWVLVSNEMNFLWRFQYPGALALMAGWPGVVRGVMNRWSVRFRGAAPSGGPRRGVQLAALGVGVLVIGFQHRTFSTPSVHRDGRADVGRALARFAGRGYSLATTEAGLLPYRSGWPARDAWGLNDPEIARVLGRVTAGYLDRHRPTVLLVRMAGSPLRPAPAPRSPWEEMAATMDRWARAHGYRLAAAYGPDLGVAHYYWVDGEAPDAAALVEAIRLPRYHWFATGAPVPDLRPEALGVGGS